MTTHLTSKLAPLAFALFVNGLLIGGVAYLFSGAAQAAELDQAACSAGKAIPALASANRPVAGSNGRA